MIEYKIIPFLNILCWFESKINLPFGIGLMYILEKR